MKALTGQQRKVLDFVDSFRSRTGYPPTLQEIGEAVGVRNVNAVRGHLAALEKKGYIARTPDKARSIRILHTPSMVSRLKRRVHQVLRTDEGVVHQVVYGLAWVTHHRRPLLVDQRRTWMDEALECEAVEHGWRLLSKRVGPDHIALVVKAWPNHSPELIVERFKAAGDGMRKHYPEESQGTSLWARGYAVTTDIEMLDELLSELLSAQGASRDAEGGAEHGFDGPS